MSSVFEGHSCCTALFQAMNLQGSHAQWQLIFFSQLLCCDVFIKIGEVRICGSGTPWTHRDTYILVCWMSWCVVKDEPPLCTGKEEPPESSADCPVETQHKLEAKDKQIIPDLEIPHSYSQILLMGDELFVQILIADTSLPYKIESLNGSGCTTTGSSGAKVGQARKCIMG